MQPDFQSIDEYVVHSRLGEGGQANVYLASKDKELFAIKVYLEGVSRKEAFKSEVNFLSRLHHKNLINMVDSKINGKVKLQGKDEEQRPIIVLEYAEGGELFDYVSKQGKFQPEFCRTLIKNLISAIQYMHENGVTHRDLKLENILFDRHFNIKISDFGLSTFNEGPDKDGVLRSKVGTEGYKPPEMEKGEYTGLQADIFAIGVILFLLYTGSPPFLSTKSSDKIYRLIRDCKFDRFWAIHEKKKQEGFYSDSFKRLMNSFFSSSIEQRPTFDSLREDEWLNSKSASLQEIYLEMQKRNVSIQEQDEIKKKIHEITFKLRQQSIKMQEQQEASCTRNMEVSGFVQDCLNFSTKLSEEALQITTQKIPSSNQKPEFVLAWLKSYLQQSVTKNETFLPSSPFHITIEESTFQFLEEDHKISIKMLFEIDEQYFQELELQGQLVMTAGNQIGVDWEKKKGNQFWLGLLILQLNNQIKLLHYPKEVCPKEVCPKEVCPKEVYHEEGEK